MHWYGILYAVAFAAGFRYGVLPHLLPRGVSRAECDRMLVWAIVGGLLGARFYYVVQQPLGDYLRNPVRIIAVYGLEELLKIEDPTRAMVWIAASSPKAERARQSGLAVAHPYAAGSV